MHCRNRQRPQSHDLARAVADVARCEQLETRRLLTVLTFDTSAVDGTSVSQSYGDRAPGTQNVNVSYGPVGNNARTWTDDYGDLKHILYAGASAGGLLDVKLSADLGFQAQLKSIDLAGKNNHDYTIKAVQVFDGADHLLFSQKNVLVQGDGTGPRHTHIDFSSLSSRVIRLRIDASNQGIDGDKIGIDNVTFTQSTGMSAAADGFGDVVLGFKDSGKGTLKGPYGGEHSSISATPVALGVVLGEDPSNDANYLSLPTGSYVIVGFVDETMVDGPGADLIIPELVNSGEQADVYVSADNVNFTKIGRAVSGTANKFDLASIGFKLAVRSVKIVGLDNSGDSPGFDVVNVQIASGSIGTADPSAASLLFATMGTDGKISVAGTSSNDRIAVTDNSEMIDVNRNGITQSFNAGITKAIAIDAGGGNDSMAVGPGVMGIYCLGGSGNDTLSGGDGKDTLTGGAGKNKMFGNNGDDRLNGSGSRDYIDGGAGNDRCYGNGGNDTLLGGAGVDRLFGGDAQDIIYGGSSNDKLYGEAGDDTLVGQKQADLLDGGTGSDTAYKDSLDTLVSIETVK